MGGVTCYTAPYTRKRNARENQNNMSRPRSPYLRADTKLSLPAAITAEIDLVLEDPLTRKPRYGARSKLVVALFEIWLAHVRGKPVPPFPTLEELRGASNGCK